MADLVASSDVIITMVGYPADVEEVFIGPAGILENAPAGAQVEFRKMETASDSAKREAAPKGNAVKHFFIGNPNV